MVRYDCIASYYVFPMGAIAKKDSPDPANPIMRPTDDHTKTGTNKITDMPFLRYALTTYSIVSAWSKGLLARAKAMWLVSSLQQSNRSLLRSTSTCCFK